MEEERFHQISLTCIPGIGNQTIKQLLAYCGNATKIFSSYPGKLKKIPGIGEKTVSLLKQTNTRKAATQKLRLMEEHQVNWLFYTDELFPNRLRQCIDSPVIILFQGDNVFNRPRVISIVGTRNASEYGRMLTKEIVKGLKKFECVIVSGLAYGIDITAHKAALEANMITWAVIASGHDKIYPSAHLNACQMIIETGCVISEYMPGQIPDATNFPERNRIIAGISDATLVVEANETGGALITADIANSYNREVFATPGPVGSPTSAGCHNLIMHHKAHLITSADDIGKLLDWDLSPGKQKALSEEDFSDDEFAIISLLKEKELHIDDISWKSGLPISNLATLLLTLEMKGIIRALPGKKFRLFFN